jgi:hypothetical protein
VRVARQRIRHLPRALAARPHPIVAELLEGSRRGMGPRVRLGKEGPEARRGGATGSGRAAGRRREIGKGKEKGQKMLTCGPRVLERKGRARERAHVGRAAERERKEREREKELGLDSLAGRAHARERKEREVGCGGRSRPKGERGKGRRPGCWALFFCFSFPHSNYSNNSI